jgi:hypothetical protein
MILEIKTKLVVLFLGVTIMVICILDKKGH